MPNTDYGSRQHFRYALVSGTPLYLGGGSRDAFNIVNEGGPNIRIGNMTGSADLMNFGYLLYSGTSLLDMFSDDPWWALSQGATSGSVSGFITRSG